MSSFVQGEMKNKSLSDVGKSKKKKVLYENGTSDSTSGTTEQKKLLKVFAIRMFADQNGMVSKTNFFC